MLHRSVLTGKLLLLLIFDFVLFGQSFVAGGERRWVWHHSLLLVVVVVVAAANVWLCERLLMFWVTAKGVEIRRGYVLRWGSKTEAVGLDKPQTTRHTAVDLTKKIGYP